MENIHPLPEQMEAFMKETGDDAPIAMINLLKYRDNAKYPDGMDVEPCTGREAYQRYGDLAGEKVAASGGRLIWMGSVAAVVIGPSDETWDDALLVEYPSRKAFFEMASDPEYQRLAVHRSAALADSRLIAVNTQAAIFETLKK
jgi:uncharacterized protein (DUF1330 family)